MSLLEFEAVLWQAGADVYELAAPERETRFVVWAQLSAVTVPGDDVQSLRWPRVAVRAATQLEGDTLFPALLDALDAAGLSYSAPVYGYQDAPLLRSMELEVDVV